jgi:PEP-CTERM motif
MMTMRRSRRLAVLGLALAASFMHAGWARAAQLSFNLNAQPGEGRIAYAGGAAPLVGGNLGVLTVKGLDTPNSHDEALAVEKGTLNFSTGAFTNATPANPGVTSSAQNWNFAPGGSLTVSGGIPSLGIADGTPLLTGAFTDSTFVRSLGVADLKVQGGAVFNVVNSQLAAYFGMPTGASAYVGGLSTMFAAAGTAPGAFSSSGYTSGQITTTPVPEPTTFVVLAVAFGAGFAWRRRRSA